MYASLHNHTMYSNLRLRDSIGTTQELINRAIELGHSGIAITEHETIANAIEVEDCAAEIKKTNPDFKIMRGNEIYLVRNGLNADNFNKDYDRYTHFILLALDAEGHKQIRQLSTRAWMRSYMAKGQRRVPTYYQDLIDIIGENRGHLIGSTACFIAGTQVETRNGWKNIEDIQAGDYVINRFGEWEEVIEPTSMMTHQYGYIIEITGNERPITCTDNHEFLVISNNNKTPRWVQAKDLNLTPRSGNKSIGLEPVNYSYNQNNIIYKEEWNNSFIKDSKYSHKSIFLPNEIILTPELMRLFGLFLGDGCISLKVNPRISFTFNEDEYENYMNSFIIPASEQLGITWNVNRRPENHRVDINSASVELINLFYYLFGDVKADNKHVPKRLRISQELDYELIFGYMLADGYFRVRMNSGKCAGYDCGEFTTVSISKTLSYDIYNILNQLHITSSISLSKGKIDKNGTNHQDAWYVHGANKILGKINKLIPYSHSEIINIFNEAQEVKEKDYIQINNTWYRKIRFKKATKIELNEVVYCLNNTTHSFKCENLIVHNCIGGALGTQLLRYRQNKDEKLLNKIKLWCKQINEIFGENNFYLEMQPSNNEEQIYVNKWIIKLSNELNIPFIITNDAHYVKKEDLKIEKIFLNAQGGDREVESFYATTYLMSEQEIHEFMDKSIGENNVDAAFKNSNNILSRATEYTLKKPLKIPELQWREVISYYTEYPEWFKKIPTLEKFLNSEYKSDRYLVNAVIDGIKRHSDLQNDEAYKELDLCLQDTWISSQVNNAQWSAYFLNLQRIIDVCWEAGTIVGCGRGSGVGFLLLYCLDIIQINCLRETTKTYRFRFLNPDRVSVLDIDSDITGLNRAKILNYIRQVYGDDRVANVLTLRTEKSKSAILAAARGLGIDVDEAQYISSLIPAERGQLWSLHDCMYGNGDDRQPIKQFVYEMTENYPEIWEVVQKTEGLIVGYGIHAGGLVFVDEPFTETSALMRAPDGTLETQFELHTLESVSAIKYDMLSVEAIDKIQICLDLLIEQGYVEKKNSLRETYESVLGIYNIERNEPKMWEKVWKHEIPSLFQMDSSAGGHGIDLIHPKDVGELATLNSVIRLMAPEKGAEQPLESWARYRNNIKEWHDEMHSYGLNDEDIQWLGNYPDITNGLAESQEALMKLVMEPKLGGNNLQFADKCRKALAKKVGKLFIECEEQFFENAQAKNCNMTLTHYVWDILLRVQRSYAFNKSHTLAYSLVALQEMNLAFKYPIMFWNCACLISDAGGTDDEESENIEEIFNEETAQSSSELEDFNSNDEGEEDFSYDEDEDSDGFPIEVVALKSGKKKKKIKATNYGKVATAIGTIKSTGVNVINPDINKSSFTFSPDIENNAIRYGLSGITRISKDMIKTIIDGRPYNSFDDFNKRIKTNKTQMISLIKAGVFDSFAPREKIMEAYIYSISDIKKELNLRNLQMLITKNLLPTDIFEFDIKVFNFNKYIKKTKVDGYYILDQIAFNFYSQHFDIDELIATDESFKFKLPELYWNKQYKKSQANIRPYIINNQAKLLEAVNSAAIKEMTDKYALGSKLKWEMESVGYYSKGHELDNMNDEAVGVQNYFYMDEEPEIERWFPIKGKFIPIMKITRIAGTILDKNKAKHSITLLTKDGVVSVKIYGDVFNKFDRQLSIKGPDGKRHVVEKSWLSRGNKIIVTGIRQGDSFICKKYKTTKWHLLELIENINDDGTLVTKTERADIA